MSGVVKELKSSKQNKKNPLNFTGIMAHNKSQARDFELTTLCSIPICKDRQAFYKDCFQNLGLGFQYKPDWARLKICPQNTDLNCIQGQAHTHAHSFKNYIYIKKQ